ncbi:MAG: hypothetical protein ABSB67_03805 [Bryobacteraceae bacterium]|jgi:hypothetical protein
MLRRSVIIACIGFVSLSAAIWHGAKSAAPVSPPGNPLVWKEFGLKEAERADFGSRQVTAYLMQDVTGAVAAQEWLSGGDPTATQIGRLVLTCSGHCSATLAEFQRFLPGTTGGAGPSLPAYLPQRDQIKGTERYILGPFSLAEFATVIPEGAVGFQFSPEADLIHYRTRAGEATLAVFSYPTPQIARQQADAFRKLNGAFVKRTGPLVAIATGISDQNAAWDLLNQVNYEAEVTMNEAAKRNQAKSIANMVLSIFALAGILIVFCFLSGVLFAGGRVMLRRFGLLNAGDAVIALHLSDS